MHRNNTTNIQNGAASIIIIVNFSQKHGLHKRLCLQMCSPEYKLTYTHKIGIHIHIHTHKVAIQIQHSYIQRTIQDKSKVADQKQGHTYNYTKL